MKHTLKQVFSSPRFVVGFVIFTFVQGLASVIQYGRESKGEMS